MNAALTLDDLPRWPHYAYPDGYTPRSVCDALISGLERHGVTGVYAFSNSKPLEDDGSLKAIMDDWVAAGHHVGNHTHSHTLISETDAEGFIREIDLAHHQLSPWLSKAPALYFRHTLNLWGETEEKLNRVREHLAALRYTIGEVTCWLYEWDWDRAFSACLAKGDDEGIRFLKKSFIDYVPKQLAYDREGAQALFGRDISHVILIHAVPFMGEVMAEFLDALKSHGIVFSPMEEIAGDPLYGRAATFTCPKFLNYWRKLRWHEGKQTPARPPETQGTYKRVLAMGGA
jgi:peptidoglycan-N-acetylglucosamine deacetylase